MSLTFVNLKGQPVSTAPVKVTKSKPLAPDTFHKGYLVVGYSPIQIAQARIRHQSSGSEKDFDEAAFMRSSKPWKVAKDPYAVYDAANTCADLARKAGWKVVQVQPVAKGRA